MGGIASSAQAMLAMLNVCEPLVLRYETRPRDAATVAQIAASIGVALRDADAQAIAAKLSAESVAGFIDDLVTTGYFGADPKVGHHRETLWHPRHLGAGTSGRHVERLSAEQIAAIDDATRVFRRAFGYMRAGE